MSLPMKGALRQSLSEPYVGAEVWGTGINPVHSVYGEGPPLRTSGRNGNVPTVSPAESNDDETRPQDFYEFNDYDIAYLDANPYDAAITLDIDDRPQWNEQPPDYRSDTSQYPSWNAPQSVNEVYRGQHLGARKTWLYNGQEYGGGAEPPNSLPSETVSNGWLNKITGLIADAKPSADQQIFIQTSMMQRYRARNNKHAVARGTDDPRTDIQSRVGGQKVKHYSGQDVGSPRYYDMFPYQQDQILRPFRYRTAGTGPEYYLEPNAMNVQTPIERIPPPDPSVGSPEGGQTQDYGYTGEDSFYA